MGSLCLDGRCRCTLTLFGLDNGTFYEEDEEDGTRRLPSRDEKGQYHVIGKMVVAAPGRL